MTVFLCWSWNHLSSRDLCSVAAWALCCLACSRFLFFFLINLFLAVLGLPSCTSFSLVAESGSYSLVVVLGFSLQYRLLLWSTGSRAQAPWLWHMGLVAAQHVGSFWIRDQTCVFCTGRQILPLSHQGSPGSFS